MIVDPEFFDHWRTQMVIDALDDACAPLYIMRLWAHCQTRRSERFAMPARGLKAQCRYPGDAQKFEDALIDAGYIAREGDSVVVLGWLEKNASLVKNWTNGGKGGRPKKEPSENPEETQGEPKENPEETQGEPKENPGQTQQKPIREDKRREDKNREEGVGERGVGREETSAADAADARSPSCPHAKLLELFGKNLPSMPQPRAELWGGTRKRCMRDRWLWVLTAKKPSGAHYAETPEEAIDFFDRFFAYVAQSDFLTGRNGKWHGCTLEWLLKEANFAKVIEGTYNHEEERAAA